MVPHGYVALVEIEDAKVITILAVRIQRSDDYYQNRKHENRRCVLHVITPKVMLRLVLF